MSALVVRILALTESSSRDNLQPLTDNDLSDDAFAWLSVHAGEVGYARDVCLIRVSYAGEPGWEIHHPVSCNRHLTDLPIRIGARNAGVHEDVPAVPDQQVGVYHSHRQDGYRDGGAIHLSIVNERIEVPPAKALL